VLDVSVGLGRDNTLGFVVLATEKTSGFGNIWVVTLGLEWVSLGVREGSVHHTSVTSKVQPGAVDELLLGEGDKVSGLDEVSTFHGTSGGEGPA